MGRFEHILCPSQILQRRSPIFGGEEYLDIDSIIYVSLAASLTFTFILLKLVTLVFGQMKVLWMTPLKILSPLAPKYMAAHLFWENYSDEQGIHSQLLESAHLSLLCSEPVPFRFQKYTSSITVLTHGGQCSCCIHNTKCSCIWCFFQFSLQFFIGSLCITQRLNIFLRTGQLFGQAHNTLHLYLKACSQHFTSLGN